MTDEPARGRDAHGRRAQEDELEELRRVARESRNPNRRLWAERRIARIEGRARSQGRDVASEPLDAPAGQQETRRLAERTRAAAASRNPHGEGGLQRRGAGRRQDQEARPEGATSPGGSPGIPAVVAAVEDVEFPTTREDLVDARGERRVEIARGVKPPLREVLRKAGGGRFESLDDLKTTLHKNWDAVRTLGRDR